MTIDQRANSLSPPTSLRRTRSEDAETFPDLEPPIHTLLDSVPLAILLLDSQGTIHYANTPALRCFGYQAADLHGQLLDLLIPPSLQSQHTEWCQTYPSYLEQRTLPLRHLNGRRKNGTVQPIIVSWNPMNYDGCQRIACMVADLSDVQRSELDQMQFFDLSLDLFCIARVDGYFQRINPNFTRVLGYSEKVLLSKPFLEFVHPDDVAATLQAIEHLAHGESIVHFRNRYQTATGEYRWLDWSSRAIPEQGRIFAVARDVSEQVRLEEELLARERRERAILENTPAIVYVKDRCGRYEYVNQRHADLIEMSAADVVGKIDHDIFPTDAADAFRANDLQVLEKGATITIQETLPLDDGLHTYISTKFPLHDAQGSVSAIAGISTDITDQIQARETANQLRLARAFQMKLYPSSAPTVKGLDASGSAVPVAQVCGDYYDFIPSGDGQLIVAMGDVSGHGIGPALEMVSVRTAMRLLLREDGSLLRATERLNEMLCDDLPESSFVSMFLAELDATRRQIRYIGAGHEALVIRHHGAIERLESTSTLLGIDRQAVFAEQIVTPMQSGDVFLLYTDGLTEAMNLAGQQFGTPRLMELARQNYQRSAEDIIVTVFSTVYEFSSGKTIADDMTIVAIKFL